MNRSLKPCFNVLIAIAEHSLEGGDHIADHIFGRVMQQRGKLPFLIKIGRD